MSTFKLVERGKRKKKFDLAIEVKRPCDVIPPPGSSHMKDRSAQVYFSLCIWKYLTYNSKLTQNVMYRYID